MMRIKGQDALEVWIGLIIIIIYSIAHICNKIIKKVQKIWRKNHAGKVRS